MRKRPQPLKVPDRYPFFVVDMTEERGEKVHMRIPSHPFMAELRPLMQEMAGIEHPNSLAVIGMLIGEAWRDQVWELEALHKGLEGLALGRAVYEELHDDGYTFSQILALYFTIMSAVTDHIQLSEEAAERASFFSQKMAALSSSGSTSESNT